MAVWVDRWMDSKYEMHVFVLIHHFQVQVTEPGGGGVLQRSHPRGGRRQPGAPTEV